MNILFSILSVFIMSTNNSSMVFDAEKGKTLKISYYGSRLEQNDAASLQEAGIPPQNAYPAFGLSGEGESAIAVTHSDGNMTLDLRLDEIREGSWEGGKTLCFISKDSAYPVSVSNWFKSYDEQDIIETWVEIYNGERKPVVLRKYYSGQLPIRRGDVWTSTLHGRWGAEAQVVDEKLDRGLRIVRNTDGVRNAQTSHAEVMISLDGKPRENEGRVIGAALCWSGNFDLLFETGWGDYHHFFAGICAENSDYPLEKGQTFTTPALAYSYSSEGLGGVSRNFHRWGRKYMLAHGDRERKILLNSWEGVYLDIKQPEMAQMMEDIASLGGELFVMDDGWFGGKYPRVTDDRGLGDWVVDKSKLPDGIGWLVKTAEKNGIRFGIWIEPEMTNTISELYEKHPDWVLKAQEREEIKGRGGTQLVLDMSNPAVQDFVFKVVDNLMKENPEIDYIKWDANMNVMSYGSQYLKYQSQLAYEYHKGLVTTLKRIREAYPDVTMQACASGGGRASWGVLPWFDEFWVSDNTDAYQRVFMQWGTSYFYPAMAMASHISAPKNHQTHRSTPLKFRCDVAMTGRLGMEMQPNTMTDEEKAFCKNVISNYKLVRPVIQFGDLYRLVSPFSDAGIASEMFVSQDKSKAVFFWFRLKTLYDTHYPRVQMKGLDPDAMYRFTELNCIDSKPMKCEGKTFSGRFLMDNGLEIGPAVHDVKKEQKSDLSSRVLLLEKI